MEKEFIPYEQAVALKELGFDEPCYGYYTHNQKLCRYGSTNDTDDFQMCTHNEIYKTYSLAPTFSQALRWFREKYFMEGFVFMVDCVNKTYEYHIDFTDREDKELYTFEHIPQCFVSENHFSKYPEAELACLIKLIEIVKNK
jgi:hypothetical protein